MFMMATHVDDLLRACRSEVSHIMQEVRRSLTFGKEETGSFKFCGRELVQRDDFTIHLTCRGTTLKLEEIVPSSEHQRIRKTKDEPLTKDEQEQNESVVGGLQWVARICRLGILASVSKLQQFKRHATVSTLNMCNKVVR